MSGDLDLQGFKKAMKDEAVLEKVSVATKVSIDYFKSMDESQIEEVFNQIDTDGSGSVDFTEWVTALVKTRHAQYLEEKAAQQEAMNAVMKDAEAALDEAD